MKSKLRMNLQMHGAGNPDVDANIKEILNASKLLDVRCELVNETETEVDIYLYGQIVNEKPVNWWTGEEEDGEYIYPANVRELVENAGDKDINLHINSTGGNVYASVAINNYLRQAKNTINVYIDGVAASGASIIAMAGDKIIMPSNTTMMIHRASVGIWGNAEELRKTAETLDKFDTTVLNSYMSRFVGTEEELEGLISDETWLTAEECKVFGLCDEIADELELKDTTVKSKLDIDNKENLFEKYKLAKKDDKEINTKETLLDKFKGGNK